MHVMRRVAVMGAIAAMLVGCVPSVRDLKPQLSAQDSGTIWFTPDGTAVISGDLGIPDRGRPVPAVVVMHGCGGVGNTETGWAAVLRRAGYATFLVDSFGGRGIRETCTGGFPVGVRVHDAYAALKIVATHSRLDRARIALMGFSHGGSAALAGATASVRQRLVPAGGPTFRAFLAFYPGCFIRYPELMQLSGPLRIHHGELDDWWPAAPCVRLVADQKARGQDAEITTYAGAHHAFDNVGRAITRRPDVYSAVGCLIELPSFGATFPESELARCRQKGATVGWNPDATEAARQHVLTQLGMLLR